MSETKMSDVDARAIQYEAAIDYLTKKREDIYIDLPRLSRYNRLLDALKVAFNNRWVK